MKKFAMLAAALVGLAAATPARANVEVGTLTCRSLGTSTYVIVSGRGLGCIFTPSNGGPAQHYQANIHRFGAQAGVSSDVALAWAVFAPTSRVGSGSLAGSYDGVSAGAAVVVGVGANGLVGGANSITLQPLSVQAELGLNVVATVTSLDLEPVLPAHRYRHHRRHRH